MNLVSLSEIFPNYKEIMGQLKDSMSLHQVHLMGNWGEQIQMAQGLANSIQVIDHSALFSHYSVISDVVRDQFIETIDLSQLRIASDNIGSNLQVSQLLREQLMENYAVFNSIHSNLIENIKPILDLNTSNSLQGIFDSIRINELQELASLVELPVLSQLSINLLASIQSQNETSQFDFGEGLLNRISVLLADVANNQTLQLDETILSRFEELLVNHTNKLKSSRITREGIFQVVRDVVLLLTLILTWLSVESSFETGRDIVHIRNQVTEQVVISKAIESNTDDLESQLEIIHNNSSLTNQRLETIIALGERLMPYVEQSGDLSEEATILVAKKSALVYTEPSKNSPIIIRVYPNQLVEQIKREKDWVYIEYFDFIEGVPRTGWVYRRNFVLSK
ncbi:MAG: SH3 domain-containing protein [Chloroflexi bacterium]|nr:SH3 domain-containing protein [Chloroflexota bacterium]